MWHSIPTQQGEVRALMSQAPSKRLIEQTQLLNQDIQADALIRLMPDAHVGSRYPNGAAIMSESIYPSLLGTDIGCGMSVFALTPSIDDLSLDSNQLRTVLFGGRRNVITSPRQRAAILHDGVNGLKDAWQDNSNRGIWRGIDVKQFNTVGDDKQTKGDTHLYNDWIAGSQGPHGYDAHLGSLGGGNHFAEIAVLTHGCWTSSMRLSAGHVCLVVHSGSLGFGRAAAYHSEHYVNQAPLPYLQDSIWLGSMSSAQNFARINRLCIGLAVVSALGLSESVQWLMDEPHNFLEQTNDGWLHRKGAAAVVDGQLGVIPGNSIDGSALIYGQNSSETLHSMAHGSGRQTSRSEARHRCEPPDVIFPLALESLPEHIAHKLKAAASEESSQAYGALEPCVQTLQAAQVITDVTRLKPVLTLKGW